MTRWVIPLSVSDVSRNDAPTASAIKRSSLSAASSDDGNAIETNALTLALSLESPGHGQWIHVKQRRYALTFVNLEVNPDGSFAGTGRMRSQIQLEPAGDEWSGTFEVDIFDPDGNEWVLDSPTCLHSSI